MNKDKGARYYPGTDEEKILMDAMEKYKLAPLRSDERKQIREDTSRLLIEKGFKRWDPITVRTWFRNNLNNAKNPILGNENEINQFSTIEPQRSPMIQNYSMMYPFVQQQPIMAPMPQQYIPAQPPQQFMQPAPFYTPTPFYAPQVMQPMPAQPPPMFPQMPKPSPNHFAPEHMKKENIPIEQPIQNNQLIEQPINQNTQMSQEIINNQTSESEVLNQSSFDPGESIKTTQEQPSNQAIQIIEKPINEQNKSEEKFQSEPLLPSNSVTEQQSINFNDTKPTKTTNPNEFFASDSLFLNDFSAFSSRPQSTNQINPQNENDEEQSEKTEQQEQQENDQNDQIQTENTNTEFNESQNLKTSEFLNESKQNSEPSTNFQSKQRQQTGNNKTRVKFGLGTNSNNNNNAFNLFNENEYRNKNNSPLISPTPSFNLFKGQTSSPSDSDSDLNNQDQGNANLKNDSSTSAYDDMFSNWDEIKDSEEEELPEVPDIGDDITNDDYDNIKYEVYQKIQLCNRILRASERKYSFEENEMQQRLHFQKNMEKRFVGLTNILSQKLGINHVFSYDRTAPDIKFANHPGLKHQISRTTKLYNDAELSDSSEPRKINGSEMPSSSSIMGKDQIKEETIKPMPSIFIPKGFSVPKSVDPNLKKFYYGQYKENGRISEQFEFVESSTFLIFDPSLLKNSIELDLGVGNPEFNNLICEPVFIFFSNKSNTHVLSFRNIEVNTGFFLRTTSMTFNLYETENGNEVNIYVCGDKRVKEFTLSLNPLNSTNSPVSYKEEENKIESTDTKITLLNTDNFYVGDDLIQSSVLKIWNNELVLGYGTSVVFWDIKQKKSAYYSQNSPRRTSSTTTTLRTSMNINMAKRSGIDLSNVSWAKGKESTKNKIIINEMQQISFLEVIHSKKEENESTFLAVASSQYPVIYIFNEDHQNISRLISHTMGISSLFSFGSELFSGSNDMSTKMWDIEKGVTKLCLNYHNDNVTAITSGMFMNKLITFTGGKDGVIKCWCITDKKSLFEIRIDDKFVPIQMIFLTNKNHDSAILKIISCYVDDNSMDDLSLNATLYHRYQILSYEF